MHVSHCTHPLHELRRQIRESLSSFHGTHRHLERRRHLLPLLLSSIPIPVRKRSSRPQEMRRDVYRIWMRDPDALLVQDARFEDEAQYVSYITSKNGE